MSQFDAFISYSHADREWVDDRLLPVLESAGLRVCIDYRDFQIGLPSLSNMEWAVTASRVTLVVLTPSWVQSAWTEFEALMVQTTDPSGRQRRIFPLLVEATDLPLRLQVLTHADLTDRAAEEQELDRLVNQLAALLEITPPVAEAQPVALTVRAPTEHSLPPRSEFINRTQEMESLQAALASRHTVVAIEGLPGIGKTSLALEVSYEVAVADQFNTVAWSSTSTQPLDLIDVIDTAADMSGALYVRKLPHSEKQAALLEHLTKTPTLLVIDGFETVTDEAVLPFLRSLPEGCKALLTSRQHVPEARTIPVGGLAETDTRQLVELEGRRLGIEGTASLRAETLEMLHERTGGSPLAIRSLLAFVREGVSLPQALDDFGAGLGEIFSETYPRIWEELGGPAQQLLMAIACFSNPVDPDVAKATAGFDDEGFAAARGRLISALMLEVEGVLYAPRFTIQPVVRAFAQSRLDELPGLKPVMMERLAVALLEKIDDLRGDYGEGFDGIEAEQPTICQVAGWCARNQRQRLAVRMLDAIMDMLWVRGRWSLRVDLAQLGLTAAQELGDGDAAGRFSHAIGWVFSRWGDQTETRHRAAQVEELMGESYPAGSNPWAHQLLGLAAFRGVAATDNEAFQAAENHLMTARQLLQNDHSADAAQHLATVKDNIGELYRDWNRPDDARRWFEEILADATANGRPERLATANGDLGDIALIAGDADTALTYFQTGLEHALRIRRLNTIALCRRGQGLALRLQGQRSQGDLQLREALQIYESLANHSRIEELNEILEDGPQ